MKNFIIALFGFLILFSSCSNDLNTIAPWKRIPIVYGFLNLADPVQYIRVEKAFLDPSVSALTIAQIPDSLYFENIEVTLTRISNNKSWTLERVDANNEGFPKKPGVFVNSPNYLYKIVTSNMELVENEAYKLTIKAVDSGNVIGESTTNVVGKYLFLNSAPPNPMNWPYATDVKFSFYSTEKYGRIADLTVIINYSETSVDNPNVYVDKKLYWKVGTNVPRPADLEAKITVATKGIELYKFLRDTLVHNPLIKRSFKDIDLVAMIGGQEFEDYIDLGNAASGITSSQIVPTYSNITNGKGIFSSRYRLEAFGYKIGNLTRDSLKNGIYTKILNFQ